MAGREVREYTNLTDPKDKKWGGKGKERIDDEELTFQRMVAKMQEVAGERGGYLHGRGALDSDDLLYLKEQMEAEEDAERLLRRTEKHTSQAPVPLPLRVEPKPKSGIRQQDLLKRVVEVKPKRQKHSNSSDGNPPLSSFSSSSGNNGSDGHNKRSDMKEVALARIPEKELSPAKAKPVSSNDPKMEENPVKSLLSAYESSDDDNDDE
ncbi:OLC1v1011973C5 [Oldenlandia corymbosa var. corymbosa]|uniref:OLC1v1011973C5 n=1 Tax=Oldenlandia corymbosa var. corymbosa TaxID=529605 RepID=A0AAV1DXX9_OLDCO|nr:OLC1v1011973C5 [Oldenlandia corymbosa var. corymbosa]